VRDQRKKIENVAKYVGLALTKEPEEGEVSVPLMKSSKDE
jgi:hypothetical protein